MAAEVPDAVATDAAGRVYMIGSDAGYGDDTSTVRIYDPAGGLRDSWQVPFPNLGDLVVDAAGNVHIADYSGHIPADIPAGVYVFTPTGQPVRDYKMAPCCSVNETAAGIGIGPNGRTYVASPTSDQVVVFNADGTRRRHSAAPAPSRPPPSAAATPCPA